MLHKHAWARGVGEWQFVSTENATAVTKDGGKRGGNLICTIRLLRLALDQFYKQQLEWMGVAAKHQ